MDDYQRASKIEEHFGAPAIKYIGLLVIGRASFMQSAGLARRFEWRRRHTIINSLHVHCVTFDELAMELKANCNRLLAMTAL